MCVYKRARSKGTTINNGLNVVAPNDKPASFCHRYLGTFTPIHLAAVTVRFTFSQGFSNCFAKWFRISIWRNISKLIYIIILTTTQKISTIRRRGTKVAFLTEKSKKRVTQFFFGCLKCPEPKSRSRIRKTVGLTDCGTQQLLGELLILSI